MEGDRYENEQRTSFYLFIYLFIYYFFVYLFIYFACHFLKPLKFVWGLPIWTVLPGKSYFMLGQNQET